MTVTLEEVLILKRELDEINNDIAKAKGTLGALIVQRDTYESQLLAHGVEPDKAAQVLKELEESITQRYEQAKELSTTIKAALTSVGEGNNNG